MRNAEFSRLKYFYGTWGLLQPKVLSSQQTMIVVMGAALLAQEGALPDGADACKRGSATRAFKRRVHTRAEAALGCLTLNITGCPESPEALALAAAAEEARKSGAAQPHAAVRLSSSLPAVRSG